MHGWPRSRSCQRSQSSLALQLGFDLLVSESLLCSARRAHGCERHGSLAGRFGVLRRLSSSSLDGFLARIIHNHAPRRDLDLALRIRHVVSRRRLEDLNLAGRSPLHSTKSITARLRIPQQRSLATSTTVLDAIKKPCLLLGAQREDLRYKRSLLRALCFLQSHHGLLQTFFSSVLVFCLLFAHLPVDLPPVFRVFRVEHLALCV